MASTLAWLLATPVALLTAVFAIEVLSGLKPGRRRGRTLSKARFVIVVPAHNEAEGIERTVTGLRAAAEGVARVLVIADNCEDGTAALASRAGAEVVERRDPSRRGKGYALAHARDHLASDPPDVLAVLDADCQLDRASLQALFAGAQEGPAQAINLLAPDMTAGAMVQVSNFAFLVKNLIRQRGLLRLSGRVNLTGTGMAMPWPLFRDALLATDDLVEDLGLGLDLAAGGHRAALIEEATVWSPASTGGGTLKQRTRWEGGFLSTSRRRAAPAIAAALRHGSATDLWAGLSLAVPPLALLVMTDIVVAFMTASLLVLGGSPVPLALVLASLAAALIALLLAWWSYGRPFLSGRAALKLPLYLVWKLPLYLKLIRGKPDSWVRTDRR
jgi:cellulose synthase/poly-beta-1,6-N-acetylglucosamine synthase-like glycosyltransferase